MIFERSLILLLAVDYFVFSKCLGLGTGICLFNYLSRYLDHETAKWSIRSSNQAVTCYSSLNTQT